MSFLCNFDEPIVETKAGKLHGFMVDDMYQFRGVKYANAERFMMPTPVEPWEGVKDASMYGCGCPTIKPPALKPYGMDFGMRYWPQNEECQYLNIWTPTLDESAKKPVMVWLHGGGYSDGSSLELVSYDGTNLSQQGDVVVVSLNHRLNILGFLNLSDYGEKYALSGTVGMADIVMALQWVQDNISKFGGDPDNVTIFGQSGGGGKVICLTQIPAAANLFHKAMIESGGCNPDMENAVEDSKKVAKAVVEELGLTRDTIDDIKNFSYEDLAKAWKNVSQHLYDQKVNINWGPMPNTYYLGHPLSVGFSEKAKNTPLIVGCCIAEQVLWKGKFYNPADPTEEKLKRAKEYYGDGGEQMIELFEKAYPDKDINDLMYLDSRFRKGAIEFLDKRAEVSNVPVYSWLLTYDFQIFGGLPAWHGSNHALTFNNCIAPVFHEPVSERLAVQMSTSWATFAHTGNPNNSTIPTWSPYEKGNEATMLFDETCTQKVDFDRELMIAHNKYCPPFDLRAKRMGVKK